MTREAVPARAFGWVLLLQPPASSGADGSSDKCLLFTDAYGRLMQLVLALSALVIMYIKRKLETPMRPVRVWALDLGKQCCGAFLIHSLSILLSIVFVAHANNNDDECGVYFVTYMLDTTWGVAVLLAILRVEHAVAERFAWRDVVESGFYGEPPRLSIWAKQLAAYALAVLAMKLLDSLVILWYYKQIAAFATTLFRSFTDHRHLELLLVMVVIPGCCNSFQFWIVDSYLKCDGLHWKYLTAMVASDDEQERASVQPLGDGAKQASPSLTVGGSPPKSLRLAGAKTVTYDTAGSFTPVEDTPTRETEATRPGLAL